MQENLKHKIDCLVESKEALQLRMVSLDKVLNSDIIQEIEKIFDGIYELEKELFNDMV